MVEMQMQQKAAGDRLNNEVEELKRKLEIQTLEGKQLQLKLQLKIMEKETTDLEARRLEIEVKLLQLGRLKNLAKEEIRDLKESLKQLNQN